MATEGQKTLLEQWGQEVERSTSWVLRQILKAEAQRREAQPETKRPASQPK